MHGDIVVDVVESADIPNPSIVTNRRGPRIIVPPTRVEWTFRQTLPPPDKPAPKVEAAYRAHVADTEVTLPIVTAAKWLDRALAML